MAGAERSTNPMCPRPSVPSALSAAARSGEAAAPRGGGTADWPSRSEMLAVGQIASAGRAVRVCFPQAAGYTPPHPNHMRVESLPA